MRRTSSILAIGATVLALSCGEPTGPELPGDDWEYLGLSGRAISSLADTEWGLFAGTNEGGVFRLDPGTGEWEALGLDHGWVETLLFVPGEPARLFAGIVPFWPAELESVLYVSQDSGRSWLPSDGGVGENIPLSAVFSLAQDPNVPTDLYCGMNSALLRSTDGAGSWSVIFDVPNTIPGAPSAAESVAISPHGRVWVAGWDSLYNGFVRWSDDMGGSWQGWDGHPDPRAVPFRVVQPDPQDRDRAWVGGSSGVFMTEDGGQSWSRTLRVDGGEVRALANDHDVFYAAGGKAYTADSGSTVVQLAIHFSRDGGRSWQPLATPHDAQGALDMVVARDGSLLIGTWSGVWRFPRRP
jgi:photosystem II stability/assembly factor-like uncharacterized protein